MRHAVVIMSVGWAFAAIMAMMPLPMFQFSSYHQTSLCLPFRFETNKDKGTYTYFETLTRSGKVVEESIPYHYFIIYVFIA